MESKFEWEVPSVYESNLRQLIGCRLLNIVKVSYETFQDHLDYLDEVGKEGYRDRLSFFKYSYGGVLLTFDNNAEYSFGSAEDLNSVIMCCEKDPILGYRPSYIMDKASVLDNTSALDFENEFQEFLNVKIVSIKILSRNDLNPKEQGLPSETGVAFLFEGGRQLILSHNLTDDNNVFGVLSEKDKITNNVIVKKEFS